MAQLVFALGELDKCTSSIGMLYANELWRNIRFHLSDTEDYPSEFRAAISYEDLTLHLVALRNHSAEFFLKFESAMGGLVEELVTENIMTQLAALYAEEANSMLLDAGQRVIMEEEKPYIGFFDGGAAPNPGCCGSGWVLYDCHGKALDAGTVYTEHGTNNEAEYAGLIGLITELEVWGVGCITVIGDSETVIKQINGQNKCRAANLKPLYNKAMSIIQQHPNWVFKSMKRKLNPTADALCKVARRTKRSEKGVGLLSMI